MLLTELNGLIARVNTYDDVSAATPFASSFGSLKDASAQARQIDLQLFQFLKRSNGHDAGPGVMFFGLRIRPRLLMQFVATAMSGLVSVGGITVNDAVGEL